MKPKTMILMGLAVTCGLGASYMTSRLLADRGNSDEKETVEVIVARRSLNIGERIVKPDEMFEKKTIFKENDTADSIRDLEPLKGRILKKSRNKGDTIFATDMYAQGENLDIPEGHLAIGLKVNQETTAGHLASLPGSRVDLIWFQRGKDNETSRTDVLLEDIFILAADGKVERDGLTAVANVVTLALTPAQNVRLNLAKETGILSFALRKPGQKESTASRGLTGDQLRRELALRNKESVESPVESHVKSADAPPRNEKKAPDRVPQVANKAETAKATSVEQPKTTKQEFTIIQANRVEHIIRDVAEDGTVLNETRRVTPLPPPLAQPAPAPKRNPENSDKSSPMDI